MSWLGFSTANRDGSQSQGERYSGDGGPPVHDESRSHRRSDRSEEKDSEKQHATSSRISRSRSPPSASSRLKMLEEGMRAQTKKIEDLELEVRRLRHEKEMDGMRREREEMWKSVEAMRKERENATLFSSLEAMRKEMEQLWKERVNATIFPNPSAVSFGPYSATPSLNPFPTRIYEPLQNRPPIISSECKGTGAIPFEAATEKLTPYSSVEDNFQSITRMIAYQNHSFEELRLADYNEGRRYGHGSGQAGGIIGASVGTEVPDTTTSSASAQIATAS